MTTNEERVTRTRGGEREASLRHLYEGFEIGQLTNLPQQIPSDDKERALKLSIIASVLSERKRVAIRHFFEQQDDLHLSEMLPVYRNSKDADDQARADVILSIIQEREAAASLAS